MEQIALKTYKTTLIDFTNQFLHSCPNLSENIRQQPLTPLFLYFLNNEIGFALKGSNTSLLGYQKFFYQIERTEVGRYIILIFRAWVYMKSIFCIKLGLWGSVI